MNPFVIGLGIGAALGVLFAPRKGEQIRAELRNRAEQLTEKGSEIAQKIPGAQQAWRSVTDTAGRAVRQTRERVQGQTDGGVLAALNSVSREELMQIEGIGTVFADRIISGRPYASEDAFAEERILPEGVWAELRRSLQQRKSA